MTETIRIENSDRGVTLNKSLAWTVGCGLIGAGLYVGLSIATMTTKLDESARGAVAATAERSQLEIRVRVLENNFSRQDAQFVALANSLEELKSEQRETNKLLREFSTN
jgi:hypothetical protein